MALYASGARKRQLTHLKVSDILTVSAWWCTSVVGKGRKDRDVMLSPKLLAALRAHWRYYHRKSSTWLFPSHYRKHLGLLIRKPFGTHVSKAAQRAVSRNACIPICFAMLSRCIHTRRARIPNDPDPARS